MKEYLYMIRPKREQFIPTMSEAESTIMGIHFEYLKNLLEEGKLILAGPCLDGSMGICILRAESWEAAQAIMVKDPAVVQGVMTAELHEYRVSLMEGR